jgi:hypothetical protein
MYVIPTATPSAQVSQQGAPALLYVDPDDRGVELEVIAVIQPDQLPVIHVMPTASRRKT